MGETQRYLSISGFGALLSMSVCEFRVLQGCESPCYAWAHSWLHRLEDDRASLKLSGPHEPIYAQVYQPKTFSIISPAVHKDTSE